MGGRHLLTLGSVFLCVVVVLVAYYLFCNRIRCVVSDYLLCCFLGAPLVNCFLFCLLLINIISVNTINIFIILIS